MWIFREEIVRRQGLAFLGRLQRNFTSQSLGNSGASPWSFNIFTILAAVIPEINPEIQPGSVVISMGGVTFTDQGNGALTGSSAGNSGTILYNTGAVVLMTTVAGGTPATITFNYYPNLPTMGICKQELNSQNQFNTIFFDTTYAYTYSNVTEQFSQLTTTTWTGNDANFFFSTNWWVDSSTPPNKLFWVTNNNDPIRYYNGTSFTPFSPQIDSTNVAIVLVNCLALLPFRGRLLCFNTLEVNPATLTNTKYSQRVRWSAIGNPIPNGTYQPWFDNVRGLGGFLDIPTSEQITAVGFVRDNLVIYTENQTWQLRYTGRSIAPFQIERVNPELGAYSLFSAVQMDSSLVGIGDKGIVECDSYTSERIDIKIPDLVYLNSNVSANPQRVQGIRDIQQKCVYWTYVDFSVSTQTIPNTVYPNRRLVYNYENDSWAIFTDSLTALGYFQSVVSITWQNATWAWTEATYPWISNTELYPALMGGNQQGFISYLGTNIIPEGPQNEQTLTITGITGNNTTATAITSPNHNLLSGQCIHITGIPLGTPFSNTLNSPYQGLISGATQANPCVITTSLNHNLTTGAQITISNVGGMTQLNGQQCLITVLTPTTFSLSNLQGVAINSTAYSAYTSGGQYVSETINAFGIKVINNNSFELFHYNPSSGQFDIPQLDSSSLTYVGGGEIVLRDGIDIVTKKFNFADQGQNIQLGWFKILADSTPSGAFSLNMFLNYDDPNSGNQAVNWPPMNNNPSAENPDPFFNETIPTTAPTLIESALVGTVPPLTGSKFWHNVYCPIRGAFITMEFFLSNAQLAGVEQQQDIQIDALVLYMRQAGRLQTW
jgi:hypothetical protein